MLWTLGWVVVVLGRYLTFDIFLSRKVMDFGSFRFL